MSASAAEVEQQLHEELDKKQTELETLQKSFDDYVFSSKELETELETALEHLSAENAEFKKENDNAQQSVRILELQLQALKKNLPSPSSKKNSAASSNSSGGGKFFNADSDADAAAADEKRVQLEIANESLRDRVHILQATEEDLQHKLQRAEEEIIFTRSELEAIAEAKAAVETTLQLELSHCRMEVESLREEAERSNSALLLAQSQQQSQSQQQAPQRRGSADFGVTPEDVQLSELQQQLESQLQESQQQLQLLQQQVQSLQQQLEQKEIALATATRPQSLQVDHTAVVELQNEVFSLQQQLSQRVGSAQLAAKDAEIADLKAELDDFMDASNREKQQLVQEMSAKIEAMSEELNAAKAAHVSNTIASRRSNSSSSNNNNNNGSSSSSGGFVAGVICSSSNNISSNSSNSSSSAFAIDGRTSGSKQLQRVIDAADSAEMKEELINMAGKLEQVRSNNVKLLNKLQSLRGNIQVCCRTRPPSDQELQQQGRICIDAAADEQELMCYDSRVELWKSFFFDRVWNAHASQADVFADVEPMIVSVIDGYNSCILAYGQTGSGKTFTMDGYGDHYGVSYRAIQLLFDMLQMRQQQLHAHHARQKAASHPKLRALAVAATAATTTTTGANATVAAAGTAQSGRRKERQSMVVKTQSFLEYDNPLATPKAALQIDSAATTAAVEEEDSFADLPGVTMTIDDAADDAAADGSDEEEQEEQQPSQFSYSLTISMLEIYNEQVYDLLDASVGGGQNRENSNNSYNSYSNSSGNASNNSSSGLTSNGALDIRQGPDNTTNVPGLKEVPVSNINEVKQVLSKGMANRATSSTNLNEHSSRSHLIVTVEVTTQRGSSGDAPAVTGSTTSIATGGAGTSDVAVAAATAVRGKLYLVDLAGSERVRKSGVTGAEMKEAQHINKSLSALGDVMEALDKKAKHVPYRNSKLTYLLQNALGGNARTMMVVTVNPTDLSFDESLFTLQFATRVRNISLGPVQRQSNAKNLEEALKSTRAELKELRKKKQQLEEQVAELRKEQKKAPSSALVEAKMKSIEEAKKAGEILMQQLNRQITESNAKLAEERDVKEQLSIDLDLTQRNLKKALEQLKELTRELERVNLLIRKKDRELDSLQNLQNSRAAVHAPTAAATASQSAAGSSAGGSAAAAGLAARRGREVAVSISATKPAARTARAATVTTAAAAAPLRSASPRTARSSSSATPPTAAVTASPRVTPQRSSSPRPAAVSASRSSAGGSGSVTSTPVSARSAPRRAATTAAAATVSPRASSPRAPITRTPPPAIAATSPRSAEAVAKKNAKFLSATKKTENEKKKPTTTTTTTTATTTAPAATTTAAAAAALDNDKDSVVTSSTTASKRKLAFGSVVNDSSSSTTAATARKHASASSAASIISNDNCNNSISSSKNSRLPTYMRPTDSALRRQSEDGAKKPQSADADAAAKSRRARSLSPTPVATSTHTKTSLVKAGSFLSKLSTSAEKRRSWQDVLQPTAAFTNAVEAAAQERDAQQAARLQQTHALTADASFAVPVKQRVLLPEQREALRHSSSFKDKVPTPKGHRSWEDATAPTEAYLHQRDATAAEHEAVLQQQANSVHGHEPEHDAPPEAAPSPPLQHHKSFSESLSAPRGHRSWQDALQPTASFSAHISNNNNSSGGNDATSVAAATAASDGSSSTASPSTPKLHSVGSGSRLLSPTASSAARSPPSSLSRSAAVNASNNSSSHSIGADKMNSNSGSKVPKKVNSFRDETSSMSHAVQPSAISAAVAFAAASKQQQQQQSTDRSSDSTLQQHQQRLEQRKQSLQKVKAAITGTTDAAEATAATANIVVDAAATPDVDDPATPVTAATPDAATDVAIATTTADADIDVEASAVDDSETPYPPHEQISY